MKTHDFLEPLEARIAPASFTFTDVDGDTVKVTTSKGTDADLAAGTHVTAGQLTQLDLSAATFGQEFANASVTVAVMTVDPVNGDGLVNVGEIFAAGIDLHTVVVGGKAAGGHVKLKGDLGRIIVGDGVSNTAALTSLTVNSLGFYGTDTGAPDLSSVIDGRVGRLTVETDVVNARFLVLDSGGGKGASAPSASAGRSSAAQTWTAA